VAFLLKEAAGLEKASGVPNKEKVAKLSREKIEEIAKRKMPDLNTNNLESAVKIVAGTARSMGIEIENS
jgi:large subunit ribosomal protein L11